VNRPEPQPADTGGQDALHCNRIDCLTPPTLVATTRCLGCRELQLAPVCPPDARELAQEMLRGNVYSMCCNASTTLVQIRSLT
jgi:hypothetical protein